MYWMRRTAAALAITAAALVTPGVAHAQATDDYQGCPSGYVCIYPNASWNNGVPEHRYYNYQAYDLTNEFGVHRIFNNQTGGATVQTCMGYGGSNCGDKMPPWTYRDEDLTPINSILLQP